MRWRPRWTRLLEDPPETDSCDVTAASRQADAAVDLIWLGARARTVVTTLAGPVGAIAAVTIVAALLWHATGVVVEMWLRPKPESSLAHSRPQTAPAPTSVPATVRAAAPTPAPTVVTVIQVAPTQTAIAPPTAEPTVSAPPSPTVAPTVVPTVAPTLAPRPAATDKRVHTVERGETLFSIARRNGTTVGALVAAKGLPSPDAVLAVGRRLVIP